MFKQIKELGINQYNINNKKHGKWKIYVSNGKLISKGYFYNGKRQGYWEHYYDKKPDKNNRRQWGQFGYWEWLFHYNNTHITKIFIF